MIKKFDEFINEAKDAPTDIEDVLAKKIGIDKLFRFIKQDDGSYISKPMSKVYPSSGVYQAMIDHSWTFLDLYRKEDLNMMRARRCYFNNEDPKDVFGDSKYKLKHMQPVYNELVSKIKALPDEIRDIVDGSVYWLMLSPDKGICMVCYKDKYDYVMRIFFTGIRSYGHITSKTRDILRKKREGEANKKREATNAARKKEEEEYRKFREKKDAERKAEEDKKAREKEEEERKWKEEVEAFKRDHPKDAELIQYIFDTYFKNHWKPVLKKNKICEPQGKYNVIQTPVQVVDGKLYFDPMAIDIIDIQNIMKDVSKKFDVGEYYEYDSDWYAKGDRFGKEPHTDFDKYEEEWSEPDRFFISHRTLKEKEK